MSIEVKNISKNYGAQKALDNISFSIKKGEIVGFLGPNGAGKSTLMKILTTYITADEGEAKVNGYDVSNSTKNVQKSVGYLPEHNPLYLDLYIREYLAFNAAIYKVSKSRIEEVIQLTGLTPESHKKIGQLSKGYKQRVGLAAAIIHNPAVLILDEPTTGLDPQGIIDIRNLILRLRNEQNKTVLLSSHNLAEIELICNRMVIINKGRSIVEGNVSDLMNGENLILRLEASPMPAAKNVLLAWKPTLLWDNVGDASIQFPIEKSEIPSLTKLLVEQNIEIYSLEAKRTLEDYFIKIVSQ